MSLLSTSRIDRAPSRAARTLLRTETGFSVAQVMYCCTTSPWPAASTPKRCTKSAYWPDTVTSGRQHCSADRSPSKASARVTCSRRAVLSAAINVPPSQKQ